MSKEEKINKKIAELQSLFGGEPVYSKNKIIEHFCLFCSRWSYRLTSGLYFKVKYFLQRQTRGFDDLDKWNAGWYIARKAIPVLTAWRNSKMMTSSTKRHIESRHGEIIELSDDEIYRNNEEPNYFTLEEWKAILDDIIFAFNFVLDRDCVDSETYEFNKELYNTLYKRYKRGMKLLSIYYLCLWD